MVLVDPSPTLFEYEKDGAPIEDGRCGARPLLAVVSALVFTREFFELGGEPRASEFGVEEPLLLDHVNDARGWVGQ